MSICFRRFIITLSLFIATQSFALSFDAHCLRRILATQVKQKPTLKEPLAVVDIGSNTVKLAVMNTDGVVSSFRFTVDLGKSLDRSGKIDDVAFEKLKVALSKVQGELSTLQISPETVQYYATAGIRDAKNKASVLALLKNDGYAIKVLKEEEEAALVYHAILKDQPIPTEGAAVIEVGGGSTEIVQGKSLIQIESKHSNVIPYGSGTLGIEDSFNRMQVDAVREKIRKALSAEAVPVVSASRPLFVSKDSVFKTLRKIHKKRTKEDLFETGLTDQHLSYYLSDDGLRVLQKAHDKITIDGDRGLVANLPSKLMVIQEAKHYYGFKQVQFGSSGGMKRALLDEMLAKRTYNDFQTASIRFKRMMARGADRVAFRFQNTFPDAEFGEWSFRVKSAKSVQSKLVDQYRSGNFNLSELKKITAVQSQVRDGIGGRLVLEDATRERGDEIFEKLAQAAREKKIILTEIENYRGINGIPYLTDEQVVALQTISEKSTGMRPKIVIGKEAEKTSGYTTFQMNVIDDVGRLSEIQIRGSKVQEFFEFDHLIRDIQKQKPVPKWARSIERSYHVLVPEQEKAYVQYLAHYYYYLRQLELGIMENAPRFPKGIPHELKPEF